jgi:molybdate transport system substrate-binding protein
VRLVVCAPQVPCGAAATRIATAAGVQWRPVSEPNNVADVLGAVASGQADAGIVYATDVRAGTVVRIPIPPQQNTSTTYPVAALTDAGRSFAAFLTGPQAQQVLTDAGFGPP